MELALNLLWGLIFALPLCQWVRNSCAQRQERWVTIRRVGLLVCVAFLLFPVISTSDDLHATDFVEDAAFASRKARPGVSSHVLNQGGATIFVVPMSASVAPPAISSEAAVHFSSVLTLAGVLLPRAGRSPPFRFSR
ncbi:MAG: hypothetical protein DMG86_13200 [Acidobacteria bacterium]|nr:MAG: hypothetical protein AUI17_04850 [Acidobacteriales bacterium 13_2_20CM_2_55_5]OLD16246.1 MAG: hypothetical protein AUI85_09875 [Acidobacteriales bacterium 13_1_40CM_3_55_5]PYX00049.1 MAG: hypothetical protein DMG86_13200 [Acidobacteriota bacterium]PYX06690.1 MAG: hypothetical protein DMG85_12845 [Acidobacteriota bacterium]